MYPATNTAEATVWPWATERMWRSWLLLGQQYHRCGLVFPSSRWDNILQVFYNGYYILIIFSQSITDHSHWPRRLVSLDVIYRTLFTYIYYIYIYQLNIYITNSNYGVFDKPLTSLHMFPVEHDGGFRRIPSLSNSTRSVYKQQRFTRISENQYSISKEMVSINNGDIRWEYTISGSHGVNKRHHFISLHSYRNECIFTIPLTFVRKINFCVHW